MDPIYIVIILSVILNATLLIFTYQTNKSNLWQKHDIPSRYYPFDFDRNERERIREIEMKIDELERKFNVSLTTLAKQFLIFPLIEVNYFQSLNQTEVNKSLTKIFIQLEEQEEPLLGGRRKSTIGIIKAFFKKFCNIPPFCDRKENIE